MTTFNYIITIATSQSDAEYFLAVRNTIGKGRPQYGVSYEHGSLELWIVGAVKKNQEELMTKLRAVPFVQQVSVVTLSSPVTSKELLNVRELLNNIALNTDTVSDELLSLFIEAKLQGKYTYGFEIEQGQNGIPKKMRIIPAQEYPDFSPEWLTYNDNDYEILDRDLTMDDIEIRKEEIVEDVKLPLPPNKAH